MVGFEKPHPAAFLDRDGVINNIFLRNGIPNPPDSIEKIQILPGVKEAVEIIKQNGFVPVVITNQPDIARGKISYESVAEINDRIQEITGIDYFYMCPHDDESVCSCRKPKPGLIESAVSELNIDLRMSFLVGDRWRDIAAGQALGIPSYFINHNYDEKQPFKPYIEVSSLLEAVISVFGDPNDTSQ